MGGVLLFFSGVFWGRGIRYFWGKGFHWERGLTINLIVEGLKHHSLWAINKKKRSGLRMGI